jgi:hypothetical protein
MANMNPKENSVSEKDTSYLISTLKSLGISDEQNRFTVQQKVGSFNTETVTRENTIFESDDKDNIVINYYNLLGLPYNYRNTENRWSQPFKRIRYKTPIRLEGQEVKYHSPKGSGMFPFFNPGIIFKYQNKEEIETLVIVEGEKKSFKGYLDGLNIIGIPSIHGFYADEMKGMLHEDIQSVIIYCKVKNVIYLTDADTLTINWSKDKDLSKRPSSFYTAVKKFRESLQFLLDSKDVPLTNIYFSHITEKYLEDGKGLDDLLINHEKEKEKIIEDLLQFQFARTYFNCRIITDGKTDKIYKYFGLINEKEFFETYRKYIGSREFLYKGRRYEYDGESVRYVRHEDTDKFMRIGHDWFKTIGIPNKHGELERTIVPFKISEIQRDYKKFPNFIDNIPKFDAFCNEPNWTDTYKRVHNGCYNICEPLTHDFKEGSFENTAKFLKHIFGGQGNIKDGMECVILGDQFTVAMDYLSIAFQHPKHMLPVPILVSKENGTGKSTFLKWLQGVWGNNVAVLNNELFKMRFNTHYITKFFITIDEGFLDVDKKAEKERIKQLVTTDTAYMEDKGVSVKKFPYYGKLIICSNDADSVMKMEEQESRWFVIKVSPIPEESFDPELENKMKEEIPAFIHWLKNRQIFHPKEKRLWFDPKYFITEQFKTIVENTKSSLYKEIQNLIEDMFITYEINEMRIDLAWLTTTLNKDLKYRVNKTEVKKFLKETKGMLPTDNSTNVRIPILWKDGPLGEQTVEFLTYKARPYIFHAQEWVTDYKNNTKDEETDLPF